MNLSTPSRPLVEPLLGGLSAALAAPLLVAPDATLERVGLRSTPARRTMARAVGVRELVAAGGLLGTRHRALVWGRVAGDVMDLALTGREVLAAPSRGRNATRLRALLAVITGITALDLTAALRPSGDRTEDSRMDLTAATTVNKPPEEVYEFWRRFDRLPGFMAHLDRVDVTGERTSHWVASAPFGRTVEWDAEITEDEPGRAIAWHSLEGADVGNSGRVEFRPAPGARGTEVHVRLGYDVPGGKLGAAVARWAGEEPHQQLDDDLRRAKQVLETGEIARSDGAPGGKKARGEFPQHPAQPLTDEEYASLREDLRRTPGAVDGEVPA